MREGSTPSSRRTPIFFSSEKVTGEGSRNESVSELCKRLLSDKVRENSLQILRIREVFLIPQIEFIEFANIS